MEEKILKALRDLGFKLEKEGEVGYSFNYEGLTLLYMRGGDDEDFLCITLPGIVEVGEDNTPQICALMEEINSSLKYVKAYILGNNVWLFYERELFGEEDMMMVISRMVLRLAAGHGFVLREMAEIEERMTSGSPDENTTDDSVDTADNDDND